MEWEHIISVPFILTILGELRALKNQWSSIGLGFHQNFDRHAVLSIKDFPLNASLALRQGDFNR